MNNELLIKGFFTLILSISFAFALRKKPQQNDDEERPRFIPDISAALLPIFLIALMLLGSITAGKTATLQMIFSICFTVFFHISIYYLILICIQPLLRNYISARACYMLWLIPNYLYFTAQNIMTVKEPLWILKVSEKAILTLFSIWFLGFILVLSWKIISHLIFRFYILKGAKPIRDLDTLKFWRQAVNYVRPRYKDYNLVRSSKITTPLSIGFFHRTMYIVLPDKRYTEDELLLIFRHELIHISREDIWTKFFLTFCIAVCWFNPLMWFAMKRSAEDIELTCDTFVLQDSTEEERKKYASLILNTVGDERGFTTCLSASAKSLKYRLTNITKEKHTHSGALIVGIISFLLFMSCGYVSLAYGSYTGSDLIYQNEDPYTYTISHISNLKSNYDFIYDNLNETAFHDYLGGLKCLRLTGNYSFSDNRKEFFISMKNPEGGLVWITLTDHTITIMSAANDMNGETYYLEEPIDWEYLDSLSLEYPAAEITLYEGETVYKNKIQPTLYQVFTQTGTILYKSELSAYEVNGIYGDITSRFTKAVLSFSETPVRSYQVVTDFLNEIGNGELQEISLGTNTFSLPGRPASYIITVDFQDKNGKVYTAEYRFILDGID